MVKAKKNKRGTATSTFGTSVREGHDSTLFYKAKLYEGLEPAPVKEFVENPVPEEDLDSVFCQSSEAMTQLPDHSVHLMITSPPYNVSKDYDDDMSLEEYRGMLKRVFAETHRVLVTGGRACVNIANVGRKPYIPLHGMINEDMHDLGFHMRGEIVWDKGASAGGSCAWGSWQSASNPVLRDVHEYILVFSKDSFSRPKTGKENTITRDQFLEYTKSVWTFNAQSARAVGHPAPFPVELPRRLIQLYSFADEVVMDPFAGAGTTCLAALEAGRRYVGYDISPDYVELAQGRIEALRKNPRLL